jgi:hypothetical protein
MRVVTSALFDAGAVPRCAITVAVTVTSRPANAIEMVRGGKCMRGILRSIYVERMATR